MARLAGLLTIAVLGIVILHVFNGYLDAGMDAASVPHHARELMDGERIKMAGAEIPAALGPEMTSKLGRIVRDSFIGGFDIVLYIAAAMSLLASVIGLGTIGRKGGG
jgi:ABC-type dipeptide/oligopeptide/nickel transport system permease subunit